MFRVIALCLTVAAASLSSVSAGQLSAYEALRAVGRAKGDAWLSKLVTMRGADASPQPVQWVLTFKDDSARGGTREFVVSEKGIVAERAPLRLPGVPAPAVMAASALKLDSTGAFTAAEKEAARTKIGFQSLNYRLRTKADKPAWEIQLFDVDGQQVGSMELSAVNGTVVTPLKRPAGSAPVAAASPSSSPGPVVSSAPERTDTRPLGQRWVEGGGLVGHMNRWGARAWDSTSKTAGRAWESTTNGAVRAGDTIGAFFTGRPSQEAAPGN